MPAYATKDLDGRVALVTGASAGIGRAIVRELAQRGAAVAGLARRREPLEDLVREIEQGGGRARAVVCDVASASEIASATRTVEADLGRASILVNNAGIALSAPFGKTTAEMWHETMAVNLTSVFHMSQAVLPGMVERGWGRIVNIASVAGRIGFAYTTAYCASKHGVVGLTRALAIEAAPHGVTVNAVCPGWVDTDMVGRAVGNIAAKTALDQAQARRTLEEMSPQKRLMTATEIAHAVSYLVSDDAGGINGQCLVIDGGGVQA